MLNFYSFRKDYLKFEGRDRIDLINRLSTNMVNNLQKNNSIKTILTNDKGRMIDILTLYNFGEFVFTACSFNNAGNVVSHLDKYTIMDDFKVINMAGTHKTVLIFGDNADKFIQDIFKIKPGSLSYNVFEIIKRENCDSILNGNDSKLGGYMLIYDSNHHDFWHNNIFNVEILKKYDAHWIDDGAYELNRIKLGIPAFGKEISELINPLECGLNRYVSFTKGCYIGQEVIARLDTYDKISRHLVRIESENNFSGGDTKILLDGKECGFVTSANENKGLGFIKTTFLDYEKIYSLKQNDTLFKCNIFQIN